MDTVLYERTYDSSYITKCVTNAFIWNASCDDSPVDRELFFPPINDSIIWLKAGDYGVFMGEKKNHISYEVHTMLLPSARGKAISIAKGALAWVFNNTNCLRVTTTVPSYNATAIRLSKRSGMKYIGNNEKSFMKDGVLYDQLLFGISKEDVCL